MRSVPRSVWVRSAMLVFGSVSLLAFNACSASSGNQASNVIATPSAADGISQGTPLADVSFSTLDGVAVDGRGDLFALDSAQCTVWVVPRGSKTASSTKLCERKGFGDEIPNGIGVSGDGAIYANGTCHVFVAKDGSVNTISKGEPCTGYGGADNFGITVDSLGNTYYVNSGGDCHVQELAAGSNALVDRSGLCELGQSTVPSANPESTILGGLAVDGNGDVYLVDDLACSVRKLHGSEVSVAAGNGKCGFQGDGGAATSASLSLPDAVAVDGHGVLYVDDARNHRVRRVKDGVITTVAGNGTLSLTEVGDGGPATEAPLGGIIRIAVDSGGTLYIADPFHCRVRKVGSDGNIETFVGHDCPPLPTDPGATSGIATAAALLLPGSARAARSHERAR
jgi:hypothetical protein